MNQIRQFQQEKFSLPKFQGIYEKWLEFKKKFQTRVIKSSKFDDAQKIYRPQKCIIGDAEKVIGGIEKLFEA